MITLIVGKKGTGKTKKLIQAASEAVERSDGNVVVIEKGAKLTYDLTHRVRLVDTEQYAINGFDMLLGFVSGICAGNYDVTDIFVDSTFKITGKDMDMLKPFVHSLNVLAKTANTKITLLLSADETELPADLDFDIVKI